MGEPSKRLVWSKKFVESCRPLLRPARPGLKELAEKAIYWRKIHGVRIYRESEEALLWDSLEESFLGPLKFTFWFPYVELIQVSLWKAGRYLLKTSSSPAKVSKLKPFFDLWSDGCFPIGLDEDNYLLLLVAD